MTINKVSMANRFTSLNELAKYLKDWRNSNPKAFRLDGHHSIGPANPAQWIFFEISEFKPEDYKGLELNKPVDGTSWNGIYYLTAATQGLSIDAFLKLYEINPNPSSIFELTYTNGKIGIPSKRRLELKNTEVATGWFCKQHINKYPR